MKPVIGFVGFGEAAQCFAEHLKQHGLTQLAYCCGKSNHPPYSAEFRRQAEACGVQLVDDLAALPQADVIFSAVVVAVAEQTGRALAEHIRPGTLVVDVNASTPLMKRRVAEAVAAKGGRFVDANLMGAVSLYGAGVPLYSSGDGVEDFARMFTPLGLKIDVAGPEAGTAAAVKMLRSVVTKGIEALVIEALTAASVAGVRAQALEGICAPMDAIRFTDFVDMCVRTDVLHAERRAVEMEGVAEGLRELGIDPVMTDAISSRLRLSAGYGLRQEFVQRPAYSADDVLDEYARRV